MNGNGLMRLVLPPVAAVILGGGGSVFIGHREIEALRREREEMVRRDLAAMEGKIDTRINDRTLGREELIRWQERQQANFEELTKAVREVRDELMRQQGRSERSP